MIKFSKLLACVACAAMLFTMTACNSSANNSPAPSKSDDSLPSVTNAATEAATEKVNYPTKQLTLVIPNTPGGASDACARIFASEAEKRLGQSILVVNKPGGNNAIGLEYLRTCDPDGYTIGYAPVESTMLQYMGQSDVSPDDFIYFARAMTIPACIAVNAKSDWYTLQDLIDYAKANPGQLLVGNGGTGNIFHLATVALGNATGTEYTSVPFDGSAPGIAALIGGNIDMIAASPTEVLSGVESGDLRCLAILGDERNIALPDVPTAKEEGIDVTVRAWGAFVVPAGTPQEIVDILDEVANESINSDEMKDFLTSRGFDHAYLNAAEMQEFVQSESQTFGELLSQLDIAP